MSIISRESTEKSVLSTCLNNLDQAWVSHIARIGGNNPETLFGYPRNAAIFSVLHSSIAESKNPSLPLVEDILDQKYSQLFEDGSYDYLHEVILEPSLDFDMMTTALDDLRESRQQRRIQREIETLNKDISSDDVDVTSEDIAQRLKEIVDGTEISRDLQTFGEMTQEILDAPAPMWTQSTRIPDLDAVLGGDGFESGTLTVVAARPKVGKTVFMNSMIYTTLESGNYPLVFNYETKKVEFLAKMISRHIQDETLGWGKIKAYISKSEEVKISAEQKREIDKALKWALDQKWYPIFDKTTSMQEMESIVTRVKSEIPEGMNVVLFVDYLQLMVTDNSNAVAQISDLTRFFKLLATTYDIAVVLLSQLNRTAGDEKPRVWQMRGSGSIEQDADVILLLDSPSRRNTEAIEENDSRHNLLEIDAGTSRLATGGDVELFIDGGIQLVDSYNVYDENDKDELNYDITDFLEDEDDEEDSTNFSL